MYIISYSRRCIVGTHQRHFGKAHLMCTHNISWRNKKNINTADLKKSALSGAMRNRLHKSMKRLRSACTLVQSNDGFQFPLTESFDNIEYIDKQRRPFYQTIQLCMRIWTYAVCIRWGAFYHVSSGMILTISVIMRWLTLHTLFYHINCIHQGLYISMKKAWIW